MTLQGFLMGFCGAQAVSALAVQMVTLFSTAHHDETRIAILSIAVAVWTCAYILVRWLPRGPLTITVPEGTTVESQGVEVLTESVGGPEDGPTRKDGRADGLRPSDFDSSSGTPADIGSSEDS